MSARSISAALVYYAPIGILIVLWELGSQCGLLNRDLVPAFSATIAELWRLSTSGDLLGHTGISMYREIAGLAGAIVVGVPLGLGMARSPLVRAVFEPLVSATYPLPKSALIPVLLIWFGIGDMSKIAAILLGCLLPIVVSSFNGARGVAHQLIWSARSMGSSRLSILRKVVLMAALPEIMSGIRIALALSFVLLISAELLMSSAGLGYLIGILGQSGNYPGMFAVVLMVTMIGFVADRTFRLLMDWALRWQR